MIKFMGVLAILVMMGSFGAWLLGFLDVITHLKVIGTAAGVFWAIIGIRMIIDL